MIWMNKYTRPWVSEDYVFGSGIMPCLNVRVKTEICDFNHKEGKPEQEV